MTKRRKSLRAVTLSALMAALLALLSPWSIPTGLIPVSLATFALFLVAALCKISVTVGATAGYLALGALGLPVFSGFSGGIAVLIGPTGGFLWGYLPAAILVSLSAKTWAQGAEEGRSGIKAKLILVVGMLAANVVIYFLGTLWYVLLMDCSVGEALATAVLPFLLPDLVKSALVYAVAPVLRKRIDTVFPM